MIIGGGKKSQQRGRKFSQTKQAQDSAAVRGSREGRRGMEGRKKKPQLKKEGG